VAASRPQGVDHYHFHLLKRIMATRVRARRARRNSGPPRWKARLLDGGIILATAVVCIFVFSFSTRLSYSDSEKHEPPVIVHVQVLNGCGRPGLARRAADQLSELAVGRMRFDVIDIGNFDRTSIRKSFVINRGMTVEEVETIVAAMALGIMDIRTSTAEFNDLGVDLTFVLGSNTLELPQIPAPTEP
jgi:hypothetical protein